MDHIEVIHPRHVWQDIGTVVTMAVNLSLSGDLDLDRCPMPCHLLQPFAVLSADTMWDELDDTNLPLLNYETGQFNKELQNINVVHLLVQLSVQSLLKF